jgi:hypothetical protein
MTEKRTLVHKWMCKASPIGYATASHTILYASTKFYHPSDVHHAPVAHPLQ